MATIAGQERYPSASQQKVDLAVNPNDDEQIAAARVKDDTTSQVKVRSFLCELMRNASCYLMPTGLWRWFFLAFQLYEEKMRKMEQQVKKLEQLKSDINRRKPF